MVVSPRATAITRQDRRRLAIFDYSVSFGLPALAMATHILYQPNRFSIAKGLGCSITSYSTWPTLLFLVVPPTTLVSLATVYSGALLQSPVSCVH